MEGLGIRLIVAVRKLSENSFSVLCEDWDEVNDGEVGLELGAKDFGVTFSVDGLLNLELACKTSHVQSASLRHPTFLLRRLLTRLCNRDLLLRLVTRPLGDVLDRGNDVHAVKHLAKDDVLAVKPRGDDRRDEELGAVRVAPGVGHGEEPGAGVAELEVLVLELVAVDRLAAGAVAAGEVAALDHE